MVKQEEVNHSYEDEIDLFELWGGLVQEKWTILIITFLFLALAVIYAFFGTKTYEVNTEILPPLEQNVVDLKYPGIPEVTPVQIYNTFSEILESEDLIKKLLEDPEIARLFVNEKQSYDQFITILQQKLSVELQKEPKVKTMFSQPLSIKLSYQNEDPDSAYLFVTKLLTIAEKDAKQRVLNEMFSLIQSKLHNNKQNYFLEDQRMSNELLSRLKRIEEEFDQAKLLGIKTPVNPFQYESPLRASNILELSNQNPVGYWLGTKILQTNINALKKRKDNMPYSQKLRDLVNEKRKLEGALTKLKSANFNVYRFSASPFVPEVPIKPKKALILAVAGVLGLMLGVFIALIRRAVKNRRQKELAKV